MGDEANEYYWMNRYTNRKGALQSQSEQTILINNLTKGRKKMKKTVFMVMGAVLMSGTAFAGITGTKHDLSTTTGISGAVLSGTAKLCEVCHAPHNAAVAVPLWNRTNPAAASITVYNTSATLSSHTKGIATLAAGSISLQCMSCHAAAPGLANTSIMKSYTLNTAIAASTWTGTISNGGLGTNLADDHPIGMNYATALAGRVANGGTALQPLATAIGSGAVFFTNGALLNQMECASCHKVHDNTNVPFLRTTNAGSALCKACHTN